MASVSPNIQKLDLLERIKKALHEDLSQADLTALEGIGHNRGPPLDDIRAGYITDVQLAEIRGVTLRALRRERQLGNGPPFVKDIGRTVLYSIPGYKGWLESRLQPARSTRLRPSDHRRGAPSTLGMTG